MRRLEVFVEMQVRRSSLDGRAMSSVERKLEKELDREGESNVTGCRFFSAQMS